MEKRTPENIIAEIRELMTEYDDLVGYDETYAGAILAKLGTQQMQTVIDAASRGHEYQTLPVALTHAFIAAYGEHMQRNETNRELLSGFPFSALNPTVFAAIIGSRLEPFAGESIGEKIFWLKVADELGPDNVRGLARITRWLRATKNILD